MKDSKKYCIVTEKGYILSSSIEESITTEVITVNSKQNKDEKIR